ncbi:hypothetical protein GJAV_G00130060 [Gymnothorax javanicus]|nr:hypothetical protein GJAV_G00130060 [Gymnothorax javanicus]
MPNFCAAPNCKMKSTEADLAFFRFPRDAQRCKRWVENCRRADMEDKTSDYLNKHYRLCAKHFEASMICKGGPYRTVLKYNAVPTIFDLSHLKNPHSRHRKQITELSDEVKKLNARGSQASVEQTEANENANTCKGQDSGDTDDDLPPLTAEEKEVRDYIKSLFEVLVVIGKQNISLNGGAEVERERKSFTPSNFQALLEYRINAGDEVLRKRFEMTAVNTEYCPANQLGQMLEVCESCIREELLQEIRESRFFSLITEELVEISGERHLPLLLRFVDRSNCTREEFIGFLPFEGDEDVLTERLLSEVTEKWGLNMEYCRGQAHVSCGMSGSKTEAIVARLTEKYPMAMCTLSSTCALNVFLANRLNLTGVQLVMSTFKRIDLFFSKSPLLVAELERAIAIFYQGKEEKASFLKDACHTTWTERHDSFELAADLLKALLHCMDTVRDNEELRWNDQITNSAYLISEALANFEFVVTLVVLKNTLCFTRAFGKNLQGHPMDVYITASSFPAVLHSLNDVLDNIEVYHEFWFEEAVALAAAMQIAVKVPRLYFRKQHGDATMEIQPECYFKEHVTGPVVERVIKELKDVFSDNLLKALKCLSLVPAVMGQVKFNTSEENDADIYKNDLPNFDTLSAEFHCWRIKWKHRAKEVSLPSTIYDTLQLSEVNFFPNVCTFLKVLCTLPVLRLEKPKCDTARKRLKAYLADTPVNHRSKSLALLNINYDIKHDLDLMVDTYAKLYLQKEHFTDAL